MQKYTNFLSIFVKNNFLVNIKKVLSLRGVTMKPVYCRQASFYLQWRILSTSSGTGVVKKIFGIKKTSLYFEKLIAGDASFAASWEWLTLLRSRENLITFLFWHMLVFYRSYESWMVTLGATSNISISSRFRCWSLCLYPRYRKKIK